MLNVITPINQLGYGITGLNILKALSKQIEVSLWPIGQANVTCQEDADVCSHAIKNAKYFDSQAPCLRIWHQFDMAMFVGNGPHIGFPIFELDEFNSVEKHHLASLDKVFVCSEWAKNVIIKNIWPIKEVPTYVVPLGVDQRTFSSGNLFTDIPQTNSDTIFFNCGKWEVRKGHDILIKAFKEAFNENDNVQLWMMTNNPFLSEEEAQQWVSMYQQGGFCQKKVKLISRVETQQEVYNIMSQSDCGVFPSRGEGWNLEAIEMLSCGKQLIITNYSAHTEFCDEKNSKLISIDETEPAYDNKWFHGQGSWAKMGESQLNQLIQHMKNVHKETQTKRTRNYFGINTANKFSWENSAKKILEYV